MAQRKIPRGTPAKIADKYQTFAPLLKQYGCIWDKNNKNYGKESFRRIAYKEIEEKMDLERKYLYFCSLQCIFCFFFFSLCVFSWFKQLICVCSILEISVIHRVLLLRLRANNKYTIWVEC